MYHGTPAGVDQNAIVGQSIQQIRVGQMQRFIRASLVQRGMERQHVGLCHQLFQRPEFAAVPTIGAWWIAQQRTHAHGFQASIQPGANIADTPYPNGFITQREAIALRQQH
ncbi:hypothetical protein D3C75_841850 [compost metagenome]